MRDFGVILSVSDLGPGDFAACCRSPAAETFELLKTPTRPRPDTATRRREDGKHKATDSRMRRARKKQSMKKKKRKKSKKHKRNHGARRAQVGFVGKGETNRLRVAQSHGKR